MSIAHLPESLYDLRPALFKLAAWLYTHYAGAELVELSHREIAEAVRLSESTVSDGMAELAGLGIIARAWDRGRYLTSVPGDRGLREGIADYGRGSPIDPPAAGDRQSIPPAAERSSTPRNTASRPAHTSCARASSKQEEDLSPDRDPPPPESQTPAREQLAARLARHGCARSVVADILAACPDLTAEEYEAQLGYLPPGKGREYLWGALRRGNRLRPAAAQDRAIDPGALTYGDAFRRGDDLDDLDPRLLGYLPQGVTYAA